MNVENYLLSAVGALAGCVVFLFAWFRTTYMDVVSKLNDCETDRVKLWEKIAELAAMIGPNANAGETLSIQKTK